jgi:UDP-N-acetylmuramate dehydrogenase
MVEGPLIQYGVSLRPFTTLRAGGAAESLALARTVDDLATLVARAQERGERPTILGWGSNVLPSDAGVKGLTVVNLTRGLRVARTGEVIVDSGCGFQEVFLRTAQAGLRGLEFAVGIPGTLGGALVSNAGAYRSCVSEFLTRLEIVIDGERKWVDPSWMEFSYRDSVLRRADSPNAIVLRIEMKLPLGEPKRIYDEAREYQRQRIGKQPPSPSAGSFFKNVQDHDLAAVLPGLSDGMRKAGVVPAGFLIEAVGLKGYRLGGAALGRRHANFIVNIGGATATEIRRLALHAKHTVAARFGVDLEEEVLYLGDWSTFRM